MTYRRWLAISTAFVMLLVVVGIQVRPALAVGNSISGVARNQQDQPIADLRVVLYQYVGVQGGWSQVTSTRTDSQGRYRFVALAGGAYRLGFHDERYYERMFVTKYYPNAPTLEQAADLVLRGNVARANIDIQLDSVSLITGRVTAEIGSLSGVTIVYAQRKEPGASTGQIVSSAYLDASGAYVLRVEPGTYQLEAENLNYPSDYGASPGEFLSEYYDNAATLENATDIVVGLDQTVSDINFQLARKARVVGVVKDERGRPVNGVTVTAWRLSETGDWQPAAYAYTNNNGSYALASLTAGAYRVGVEGCLAGGFFNNKTSLAQATTLNVTSNQEIIADIVIRPLTPPGVIQGRVTDSAGNPLSGVEVSASATNFFKSTQTDANGTYRLGDLCPATYILYFSAVNEQGEIYAPVYYKDQVDYAKATGVTVGAGATVGDINVQLPPYRQIQGQVTDTTGKGVEGIFVGVLQRIGDENNGYWSEVAWALTENFGHYTVPRVRPGRYRLRFSHYGFSPLYVTEYYPDAATVETATDITVLAGANRTGADVQLARTGQIQGRVTDTQGQPLPTIFVQAYGACRTLWEDWDQDGWCSHSSATTTVTGTYSLLGLEPGQYRVKFEDGRAQPEYVSEYYSNTATLAQAVDLQLAANEERTGIDAQLADNSQFKAYISGRVTTQGVGQIGVEVAAFRPYTVSADLTGWIMAHHTWTDLSGQYRLRISEPGRYRIGFITRYFQQTVTFYPAATTLESATDLLVSAGATLSNIDATVTPATDPANNLTLAVNDELHVTANRTGGNVLWSDLTVNQSALPPVLVQPPSYGQVLLHPDGSFIYQYQGIAPVKDAFVYQLTDGVNTSNFALVNLVVSPDPPLVARNLSLMSGINTPALDKLRVSGVTNQNLTFSLVTTGQHGKAQLTNPTTGEFIYTPLAGFVGQDSFTFKVTDSFRTSNIGTVAVAMINLAAQNSTPALAVKPPFTLTQVASSSGLPNVLVAARIDATTRQVLPPLYSLNGGVHWLPVAGLPYSHTAFLQVAIAPRAVLQQPVRLLVAPAGNTIYRTGDFGVTWAENPFPLLPTCEAHWGFGALIAAPATPQQLYINYRCQGRAGAWAGAQLTYPRAIYGSSDAGVSWQQIPFIPDKAPGSAPEPAPLIPALAPGKRLFRLEPTYLGHNLYQSDDAGEQWRPGTSIQSGLSEAGLSVLAAADDGQTLYGMAYVRSDATSLHVSAADSYQGYRSSNGGQRWTTWASQPCSVYTPAPNPAGELQLVVTAGKPTTLLLRCAHGGLYRSRDAGDSWEQLSSSAGHLLTLDYGHPGRLLWAKADGLWASDDAGDQWVQLTASYQAASVYLPVLMKQ